MDVGMDVAPKMNAPAARNEEKGKKRAPARQGFLFVCNFFFFFSLLTLAQIVSSLIRRRGKIAEVRSLMEDALCGCCVPDPTGDGRVRNGPPSSLLHRFRRILS